MFRPARPTARQRYHPRQHARAFTLIEILIVMGLLALALAVVTPRLSGTIAATQVKSSARNLMGVLRYTRQRAVSSGEQATVDFDLESKIYSYGDNREKRFPNGADVTVVTAQSEQRSELHGAIRFFPDGSSTGGRITLEGATRTLDVNVEWLTGDVQILN